MTVAFDRKFYVLYSNAAHERQPSRLVGNADQTADRRAPAVGGDHSCSPNLNSLVVLSVEVTKRWLQLEHPRRGDVVDLGHAGGNGSQFIDEIAMFEADCGHAVRIGKHDVTGSVIRMHHETMARTAVGGRFERSQTQGFENPHTGRMNPLAGEPGGCARVCFQKQHSVPALRKADRCRAANRPGTYNRNIVVSGHRRAFCFVGSIDGLSAGSVEDDRLPGSELLLQ